MEPGLEYLVPGQRDVLARGRDPAADVGLGRGRVTGDGPQLVGGVSLQGGVVGHGVDSV